MQAGVHRHYKGDLYQVLGVGEHTETKECVVVYLALTAVRVQSQAERNRVTVVAPW